MKSFFMFLLAFYAFADIFTKAQPYWESQSTGLPAGTQTIYLYFDAVNDDVCWAVNRADDNSVNHYIRTTNGGNLWEVSSIPDVPSDWRGSSVSALDENNAWIVMHVKGGPGGGVFKTTDGGTTWVHQQTAFNSSSSFPRLIHFFDALNGVCIGDPTDGYWEIYTTSDGGEMWTRVDSSKLDSLTSSEDHAKFHCSVAGNCLWFGWYDENFDHGGFYRTKDRGYNWNRKSLGEPIEFPEMRDSLNGAMVAYFPNRLFKTTNGGDTWTYSSISSVPFTTWVISYVPGTINYVLTSTSYPGFPANTPGSAYTLNGGSTWNIMDHTVSRGVYPEFASSRTGWTGGLNDSVYKYVGPDLITDVETNISQPVDYRLDQNFPNPFNPTTVINYQIPRISFVTLRVYDILGNEIATLVNEEKPTGNYKVEFNASGLASGIYFYKLRAGNFVETKKMILLR